MAAICLALLATLALVSVGIASAQEDSTKVVISNVTVKGKKVTVTGKVVPPASTSNAKPANASVALTLSGAGKPESFSAKPDSKWRFKATRTTKLTGQLTVSALVKIAGKQSGKQVRKRFQGPRVVAGPEVPPPGGSQPPPAGVGGETFTPPPPPERFDPDDLKGTPLLGVFKLEAGKQDPFTGVITGSRFKMMSLGGYPSGPFFGAGVPNANSPFQNTQYTPLRPGTDGGLSTVEYQPAAAPAFSSDLGACPCHALANRIVLPQTFFGISFSIVTDPVARGTNADGSLSIESAPLPLIVNDDGVLSGQVIAWTAAWNGLWFTQGAPKPDGTYAAFTSGNVTVPPKWDQSGTTPLKGTYNATTGRFVLEWQSLIVGGPFHNYSGQWHLEGTFEPAAP